MSALLQAVKCSDSLTTASIDPYWTLMAYFNSLRELGHAATLIRADIREYLNAMWDRMNIRRPADGSNAPDLRRFINRDLELTSRIQSTKFPRFCWTFSTAMMIREMRMAEGHIRRSTYASQQT